MKKNTLIVDGNNLMHRALNVFNLSYNGQSTSMIYGSINIIRSLITQLSADKVIVVFDGGRSKFRIDLWPEYKQRDKKEGFDSIDFGRQREILMRILTECLGITVLHKRYYEADDIIWAITRKIKRKNPVIIVSTDKDFHQILSKKVSIWNPFKNKRITHKNLKKQVGYTPEQCVDWLILMGDKSDRIPGLDGVGEKTAQKFFEEWPSIVDYLISYREEFKRMPRKKLEPVFLRNRALIDLRYFIRKNKFKVKDCVYNNPKFDKKKLMLEVSRYDLQSFAKDSFIKVFENLIPPKI